MTSVHQTAGPLDIVHMPANVVAPRALSVLVVEPALDQLLTTVSSLTAAGFHVTAAESFAQAKPLLSSGAPAVLVTAARLAMYNGLHLVVRGKSIQPELAALLTSRLSDPVLQSDAEALGATFVLTPVSTEELIACILQTHYRSTSGRAYPPIRPPFERRKGQRRSAIRSADAAIVERRTQDRRRILPWLVPPTPDLK